MLEFMLRLHNYCSIIVQLHTALEQFQFVMTAILFNFMFFSTCYRGKNIASNDQKNILIKLLLRPAAFDGKYFFVILALAETKIYKKKKLSFESCFSAIQIDKIKMW